MAIPHIVMNYINQKMNQKNYEYYLQGFWILVYFSTDVTHLYYARILSGLAGGGVYINISLFVADIAENQYVFYVFKFQIHTIHFLFQYSRRIWLIFGPLNKLRNRYWFHSWSLSSVFHNSSNYVDPSDNIYSIDVILHT